MKLSTRRKIYYTSVAVALVAILVSAVIINRTLVNTPKFDIESISESAGDPVSAYMAYVKEDGKLAVGITDEAGTTAEIVQFIHETAVSSAPMPNDNTKKTPDAWVILYDGENRIASRMNFYDGGTTMWCDGCRFETDAEYMRRLIAYCDENIKEENEPVEPEADQGKDTEEQ